MISGQNKNKLISILEHKNYEAVGDSFIIFPDDMNTLGSIIKISNRFGMKLIPIGSGTTFDQGFKPSDNTVFLSTQRLNKILDLDRNNMFIELQAGCLWSQVFSDLSGQDIYFPLLPDSIGARRTAGGIFSSIKPDSAASNYFTGVEFFAPDGTLMKFGCKTLKNVAGYDLVKFMTGSLGKFGIITSLIIRLLPSKDNFFKFETLEKITEKNRQNTDNDIFKRLKNELDPNSVFE
jgi:glycolate oxidase